MRRGDGERKRYSNQAVTVVADVSDPVDSGIQRGDGQLTGNHTMSEMLSRHGRGQSYHDQNHAKLGESAGCTSRAKTDRPAVESAPECPVFTGTTVYVV
ncbi:hypothetical protein L596_005094 [Steinernema carpocapsae]|uniref:Uncharacterized protein n=1 Tax=Steinernema carpocapsae TaxID=34508 RepID=A0A4U8UZH1_STECR|nr:hypothetical protein L596_005094 [Steinernema carpocapsae]